MGASAVAQGLTSSARSRGASRLRGPAAACSVRTPPSQGGGPAHWPAGRHLPPGKVFQAAASTNGMARRRQILVIGNNTKGCTPEHEKAAYEIGAQVAASGAVLVTGGLGGVMNAASHGAHEAGGLCVGIIPQSDASMANRFCDIVIPTGMGFARDFLNALSADGIIIVGGGSGTLSEVCAAYMYKKPMVAVRNLGGTVERYIDGFLDHRQHVRIVGADTPREAVQKVLELIAAR